MTPKLSDLKYSSLIAEYLNTVLCSDIVTVTTSRSGDTIDFNFRNTFKLLIHSLKSPDKDRFFISNNTLVIFDYEFEMTKSLLTKQLTTPSFRNGSEELSNILEAFSSKNVDKQTKKNQYWKLLRFELKDLLSNHFGLGLDPRNEYFLFSNDELRTRYEEATESVSLGNSKDILIIDSSAIIVEKNGKRVIDIEHGGFYKTDTHIYLSHSIYEYVPCEREPGCTASYDSTTGITTYKRMVLKSGVDLSKEARLEYKNADQMVFKLLKNSKEEFYLTDSLGEVFIYHPDLLVYFL